MDIALLQTEVQVWQQDSQDFVFLILCYNVYLGNTEVHVELAE